MSLYVKNRFITSKFVYIALFIYLNVHQYLMPSKTFLSKVKKVLLVVEINSFHFLFFTKLSLEITKNILWDYQDNRIGQLLPQTFNSKNLYKVNHLW